MGNEEICDSKTIASFFSRIFSEENSIKPIATYTANWQEAAGVAGKANELIYKYVGK